jgi:hypothetical protein
MQNIMKCPVFKHSGMSSTKKNTKNILWCTVIYEITLLLHRTLRFPDIRTSDRTDELRGVIYCCRRNLGASHVVIADYRNHQVHRWLFPNRLTSTTSVVKLANGLKSWNEIASTQTDREGMVKKSWAYCCVLSKKLCSPYLSHGPTAFWAPWPP